jgi:hypothetical protein
MPKYLNSIQLRTAEEINLLYKIQPFLNMEPGKYVAILKVLYQDSQYEFSHTVVNQNFIILPISHTTAFLGIITFILVIGNAILV